MKKPEKTATYKESKPIAGSTPSVSILCPGIETRLGDAAKRIGKRSEAAQRAGISVATMQRYISGQGDPPLSVVIRLARAARVSIDWIATGAGESSVGVAGYVYVDKGILRDTITLIERVLESASMTLQPQQKADMVISCYDSLAATPAGSQRKQMLRTLEGLVRSALDARPVNAP